MSKKEIGCCGAYCKSCRIKTAPECKGCKLGYEDCSRDINKAKCKIKLCCFMDKKLETCADCSDFETCKILNSFYAKNGIKYLRYKNSLEFIRKNGYVEFQSTAEEWKAPFGKVKKMN